VVTLVEPPAAPNALRRNRETAQSVRIYPVSAWGIGGMKVNPAVRERATVRPQLK